MQERIAGSGLRDRQAVRARWWPFGRMRPRRGLGVQEPGRPQMNRGGLCSRVTAASIVF